MRDVAWAPSIGLPVSRIASCSQDGRVIVWRKDDTEGGAWTPQVSGITAGTYTVPCMTVWVCWYVGGTSTFLDAIPRMAAGHVVMPPYLLCAD